MQILGPFCPDLGKNEFSRKKGSVCIDSRFHRFTISELEKELGIRKELEKLKSLTNKRSYIKKCYDHYEKGKQYVRQIIYTNQGHLPTSYPYY